MELQKQKSLKALMADPSVARTFVAELLAERVRQVEKARVARDAVIEQRKKLTRDKARIDERRRVEAERRQAARNSLVDDCRLSSLPPPSKGNPLPDRPLPIKRLSIDPGLVGPVLRVWDFLYVFSQALTLSTFPLDDLTDALHYQGGPCVMLVEIHTRLLHVILRDGKMHKLLETLRGNDSGEGTKPRAVGA
ncbi:unnamed protein product, partial [Discosporangium mesarthrocarpum]